MSKLSKKSKKSTRPVVEFPFTINQTDELQFQKIAQGLYTAKYIQNAVPGVRVQIHKVTTDEITLACLYRGENGYYIGETSAYRIGLATTSDGVRYADGKRFKDTFAEFIDDIRQKHRPEVNGFADGNGSSETESSGDSYNSAD